jgi:CheY-like chemotaxis protein
VGPHRKARILLAEDAPMNQELAVTLLKRAGHEIEVVGDGAAAVDMVKHRSFDLILMDVQLPSMSGLEATRAIRALAIPMSKVPIIAMTARALSRDVEACRKAGMDDHLSKPIDAVALLAVVDRWTRSSEPIQPASAPVEPVAAQVQDPAVLAALEQQLGAERVAKMITMASEDIPQRLERMRQNLADRDLVGRDAHDLVSIAGNLGFTELGAHCHKLLAACADATEGASIAAEWEAVEAAARRAMEILGGRASSSDSDQLSAVAL